MYIHISLYTESKRAFTNLLRLPRCTEVTNHQALTVKFHFSNFQNHEVLQEEKKGKTLAFAGTAREDLQGHQSSLSLALERMSNCIYDGEQHLTSYGLFP